MSSNAAKGSKAVAQVAAASVDGYLRNASKRQRVPAAEGGRGTRRKLAMVTSAAARAAEVSPDEVADRVENTPILDADADEWDEVALPVAPVTVKKQELSEEISAVKKNRTEDVREENVKPELHSVLPIVKAEGVTPTITSSSAANHIKAETINVDEGTDGAPIMEGANLPLVGQPRSSETWRQRDPAYEAMIEQRDLLTAQRRSERIQRVCESLFALLSAFIRARLLWREASHPRFIKKVLRLHVAKGSNAAKRARTEASFDATESRYVFLKAVMEAKILVAEATKPQFRKLALAPVWVTCTKDAAQNKTSNAAMTLINAVNRYFTLVAPPNKSTTAAAALSNSSSPSNAMNGGAPAVVARTAPHVQPQDFSEWSMPIPPHFLCKMFARRHGRLDESAPIEVPHPVYFSILFLALARVAGLSCRLVVAKQAKTATEKARASVPEGVAVNQDATSNGNGNGNDNGSGNGDDGEGEGEGDGDGDGEVGSSRRRPLQKLSIFEGMGKRKIADGSGGSGPVVRVGSKRVRTKSNAGEAGEELKSKKLPTSCYWVEVWSPERESFLSVNPCQSCATLWGAPYTFSVSGHVAVDATPRYISKYSAAYMFARRLGTCQHNRFLWHDKIAWDDSREVSEVIRATFNVDETHTNALTQRQQVRESKQLHSLMYSEMVPTTLNALHQHPLYVIESDLARHEGIYPKDASTIVGSVKGHMVYKRSAIVSLRARDGWLREGRSLINEEQVAYKIVAAPASRPFAAPSAFYGRWQTRPFEPLPLISGDPPTIPHHGRTSWYILLDKAPPPGIVHMTQPQIARVARRMRLDFGLAVMGFERRKTNEQRRGHWETVINGIVVKQSDGATLLRAYEEWVQLVQEQEASKRRQRAMHWWLLFSQRLLSLKRLQDQYAKGLSAGLMPTQ